MNAKPVIVPAFERVRDGRLQVIPEHTRKKPRPKWTDREIIAALQKWTALYGEPPATADWNPALARQKGEPARQARYLSGVWPGTATVVRHFGTWANALAQAGLVTQRSGPRSEFTADPKKLSRRNIARLRSVHNQDRRVGPVELGECVRAVVAAEKTGEPELLQDALLDLAAVAVAWAERADR